MKRGRPPKDDPLDDEQPRPPAEELFDETTVEKLDRLSVPEVEDAEGVEAKLERIPESKRQEAAKALKNHYTRMRAYVYGTEDDHGG
jgi:hypothetical protein